MSVLEELERLLVELARTGYVDLGSRGIGELAGLYSRTIDDQPVTIEVNATGRRLMRQMIDVLRYDPSVAHNLRANELEEAVIQAAVQAALASDQGSLDSASLAKDLWQKVHGGQEKWLVAMPVPGLSVPAGHSIELAGLSIGALSPERQKLIEAWS